MCRPRFCEICFYVWDVCLLCFGSHIGRFDLRRRHDGDRDCKKLRRRVNRDALAVSLCFLSSLRNGEVVGDFVRKFYVYRISERKTYDNGNEDTYK